MPPGADLPLHYVRREDYVRNQTVIEAKRIKGSSDVDKTLWIIAELTGIAPPHLDGLDGEDFSALSRIFARFLGLSRPTGAA